MDEFRRSEHSISRTCREDSGQYSLKGKFRIADIIYRRKFERTCPRSWTLPSPPRSLVSAGFECGRCHLPLASQSGCKIASAVATQTEVLTSGQDTTRAEHFRVHPLSARSFTANNGVLLAKSLVGRHKWQLTGGNDSSMVTQRLISRTVSLTDL